jgi:hypothetical protein
MRATNGTYLAPGRVATRLNREYRAEAACLADSGRGPRTACRRMTAGRTRDPGRMPPWVVRTHVREHEMPLPIDHAGLEVLPFDSCLSLLAAVSVGRVGFVTDGEVVVLPVNFVMDGQDVVFRTASGSKLSCAEVRTPVAFEADNYDDLTQSGWSVLVSGRGGGGRHRERPAKPARPVPVGQCTGPPVLDPDPAHRGDRAADARFVSVEEPQPPRTFVLLVRA